MKQIYKGELVYVQSILRHILMAQSKDFIVRLSHEYRVNFRDTSPPLPPALTSVQGGRDDWL